MRLLCRVCLFAAVLCGCFLAATPAFAQTEAERAYEQARAAFAEENFEQARDLLKTAVQTDAKNPDIFLLLGKSHYQLGEIEEAIAAWRKVLQLAPGHEYAKRMVETLTDQRKLAETRLATAGDLMSRGLVDAALRELGLLSRQSPLTDEQEAAFRVLEAELHLLENAPDRAIESLTRLAAEHADAAQALRPRALLAVATVSSDASDAAAVETLQAIFKENADTQEGAIAALVLRKRELDLDPTALAPLAAWLQEHPGGPWAGKARGWAQEGITKLFARQDAATGISADSPLTDSDQTALAAAKQLFAVTEGDPGSPAFMKSLIQMMENRYAAREAFGATAAAFAAMGEFALSPEGRLALRDAGHRLTEQKAASELKKIALDPTSAAYAAWVKAHGEHPQVDEARKRLLDQYLSEAVALGAPEDETPLADEVTAAIELAGKMLAEIEQPAVAHTLAEKIVDFLENHYLKRNAHAAAVAGAEKLLAQESVSKFCLGLVLPKLAIFKLERAVYALTRQADQGTLEPGPLPANVQDVLKTLAQYRDEFPAGSPWKLPSGWQLQADLGSRALAVAAKVPWPAYVTQPKAPLSWAFELALPVVGEGDPAASAATRKILVAVIDECTTVTQPSARGMAAGLQQRLLDATGPTDDTWPGTLMRLVELLRADAVAQFQENASAGREEANDVLSEPAEAAIAHLKTLAQQRPSQADTVIAQVERVLAPWLNSRRYELVENTWDGIAEALPAPKRPLVRLKIARLWVTQVAQRHARLIAAGIKPAEELDPLMKKALVECYNQQRGLPEDAAVVGEARAVRAAVIDHYRRLNDDDAVAAAMLVKGEPAIEQVDALAELELIRHQLSLADRELRRTLAEHNGLTRLELSAAFQAARDALQEFITRRPKSRLTGAAVSELFGVARRFESRGRYDIAVAVYGDVERFAAGLKPLLRREDSQPHVAERAALALADAQKAAAEKALSEAREDLPSDAPPPDRLSDEYAAAVAAYRHVITDYADGPLVGSAISKTQQIALAYAEVGAWPVADSVFAGLAEIEVPLKSPERIAFARAVCTVGQVMPDHALELLRTLSQDTTRRREEAETMLALDFSRLDGRNFSGHHGYGGDYAVDEEGGDNDIMAADAIALARPAATPKPTSPEEPAAPSLSMTDGRAAGPGQALPGGQSGRAGESAQQVANGFLGDPASQDEAGARREATLLAAVQRRQADMASRVAHLREQQIRFVNRDLQQKDSPGVILSKAELERREKFIGEAYSALSAIMQEYPLTPTATQARGEILVLIHHWREILRWRRAAALAKRFLEDHPQDRSYPQLRAEVARDLLAWAAAGLTGGKSKQEHLAELGERFTAAREELQRIVTEFTENDAIQRQAQWDIATSYLSQARAVAALSPTLARGQFVRSAEELLEVAKQYHDHPNISSVPQLLWEISQELVSRGFYDEAISVWTSLTIHYPLDGLARQAAMQTAVTYQTQLGQPLRAVETYVELYFATGATDANIQNTVYQIALNLKGEKRWIEALHVLETFTNAFPQHPQAGQALAAIGDIHQTNEAWEDAITAYERVIDEYQNGDWKREARWSIAECKINLSEWDAAMAAYRDFVKDYADEGRVAEAQRRIDVLKNLARYQRVVDEKNQPKSFDAQYQIGAIVRLQLHNPVKAINEYRKVAKRWPDEHLADDALYQVGSLYLERGSTEAAREALLAVAEKYPNSPLADDALFAVGRSYEQEAEKYSAVTRSESAEIANVEAQRQAYQLSQSARRLNRERGQALLSDLKKAGKFEEADKEVASFAARNKQYDQAAVEVIANLARQQAETLTAEQLADRQDKINAALRRAVDVYERAARLVSGDKADDALLRMAEIYDTQLKDEDEAMAVWQEIVKQFGGTSVAENSSWKIAEYYERKDKHSEAIAAYQEFLRSYRSSSRAGDAMIAVAENYEKLDRWVDAMDWYTNYVNKYPTGAQVERAKEQIIWIKTYRL